MVEEYIDVMDENGLFTGVKATKIEAHKNGLWHQSAHIWIYNSRGEVLFQKRSMEVINYPGLLDTSSAGHVSTGERPEDAAVRELYEELGLRISFDKLKKAGALKLTDINKDWIDMEFVHVFLMNWNGDISGLRFRDGEVECVEWISLEGLEHDLNDAERRKRYVQHGKYYDYVINKIRAELNNIEVKT